MPNHSPPASWFAVVKRSGVLIGCHFDPLTCGWSGRFLGLENGRFLARICDLGGFGTNKIGIQWVYVVGNPICDAAMRFLLKFDLIQAVIFATFRGYPQKRHYGWIRYISSCYFAVKIVSIIGPCLFYVRQQFLLAWFAQRACQRRPKLSFRACWKVPDHPRFASWFDV